MCWPVWPHAAGHGQRHDYHPIQNAHGGDGRRRISITEASPYIVRTSFTVPQVVTILADWAIKNDIRKVVTLVTDYAPGVDSETWFNQRFVAQGGVVVESLRVPLRSPDFAPFLQRCAMPNPTRCSPLCPPVWAALSKQFAERGMDKAGIRVIAEGSVTDDDILDGMGEVALGVVTAHHYSAAHNSALNKRFVEAFGKANNGLRPNFMAVGAYDSACVIYEAAKATQGGTGRRCWLR